MYCSTCGSRIANDRPTCQVCDAPAVKPARPRTKNAFVIMPFAADFTECFRDIFRPALESLGYHVTRADDFFRPQPIMDHVREQILRADLLLADMSNKNPNVFYELGLAHAAGKPVLLVSRKEEDIPFDLRHVGSILYEFGRRAWKHKLRLQIQEAAAAMEGVSVPWPPPLVATRTTSPYEVRILRPRAYEEVRQGGIDVMGSYGIRPPDESLHLFVTSADGKEYWPQGPVKVREDGGWNGKVWLWEKPPREANIMVAETGEPGRVLIEYYTRAGEATGSWLPLRQLTPDMIECDRVKIRKLDL